MTLAQDHVTISIGGATVRLRASLRAAIRLERQHKGFAALLQAIQNGSIAAAQSILIECGDHPVPESLIAAPGPEPIGACLERLQPQLALIIYQLADVSPETDPNAPRASGSSVTLAVALEQLFGIATGMLGWAPADAYASTPSEIWAAMNMQLALHRAANGIPEPRKSGPDYSPLDSVGLAELASMNSF